MLTKTAVNSNGFTLIEVLVALVIVSIALFAVVRASIDNVRVTEHVQDKTEATWVASDLLARRLAGFPLSGSSAAQQTESQITQLGRNWWYDIQTKKIGARQQTTVRVGLVPTITLAEFHGYV